MALLQDREAKKAAAKPPLLLVGSRRPSPEEIERDAEEFAPSMKISGRASRKLIDRQSKA